MSREIFISINLDARCKSHEVQDAQVYNNSPCQLNPFRQVTNCNNMYLLANYLAGFKLPIGIFKYYKWTSCRNRIRLYAYVKKTGNAERAGPLKNPIDMHSVITENQPICMLYLCIGI